VPGDRGFSARYFSTASASGNHERSTEFRGTPFTRVDPRLHFTPGDRDFPLAFFNDHTRFNFMRPGEPNRRLLEFSTAWTAWLHVPVTGSRTYYLDAPQASAQLSIDATPILTAGAKPAVHTWDLALPEGWHRVHVTFSSPYGGPRQFSAGEIRDGVRMPFDVAHVRTERIDQRQMILSRLSGTVKDLADVVALAWLAALAVLVLLRRAGELWQRRRAIRTAVLTLAAAGGTVEALRFAWPWAEPLRVIGGGDDPLIYEGYARDILFNGLLMNGGLPLGQGEPFYFQAFYPYFLAATHWVFGESVFGAVFLQRLLLVLAATAMTRIAIALAGERVWPAALVVSSAFLYWKLAPISADLLNESLYVPMLMVWTLLCVELCGRPTTGRALLTGLTGGITVVTRTTVMLAWPLVWAALFRALRRSPARGRVISLLLASTAAVFSLIAIRNAFVTYRFVPMPTEFGITIGGGNETPAGIRTDPGQRKTLYDLLRVDGLTAEVMEFAITAPGAFAANLGRKALFVLGFYEPYAPGWGDSPVYIATWVSAVGGCWLLYRRGHGAISAWIPIAIAATQFVVLVLVYPKGERLIVPMHTLLVPYSAIAADQLMRFILAPPAAGVPARSTPPPSSG
jgi:hypothetical protein